MRYRLLSSSLATPRTGRRAQSPFRWVSHIAWAPTWGELNAALPRWSSLEFFEEKEHRRARSRLLTQSRGALTALRWPLSGTTKRAAIEDRIA
jgi:hypothetical protein